MCSQTFLSFLKTDSHESSAQHNSLSLTFICLLYGQLSVLTTSKSVLTRQVNTLDSYGNNQRSHGSFPSHISFMSQ